MPGLEIFCFYFFKNSLMNACRNFFLNSKTIFRKPWRIAYLSLNMTLGSTLGIPFLISSSFQFKQLDQKLITIYRCRLFIINGFFAHNSPEAEVQRIYAPRLVEQALPLSCNSTRHARNFFGLLPQGYCERKKP